MELRFGSARLRLFEDVVLLDILARWNLVILEARAPAKRSLNYIQAAQRRLLRKNAVIGEDRHCAQRHFFVEQVARAI